MSMWLEYVKVTPSTLAAIKKQPDLLESMIFGEGDPPSDFDPDVDGMGLDYRTLAAMMEGMEEIGEPTEWTRKAVGEDFGDNVDYEFCYGPAFCFNVEEVKELAAKLADEAWDPEEDFEENIGRFFAQAAKEGKAVVGGVN